MQILLLTIGNVCLYYLCYDEWIKYWVGESCVVFKGFANNFNISIKKKSWYWLVNKLFAFTSINHAKYQICSGCSTAKYKSSLILLWGNLLKNKTEVFLLSHWIRISWIKLNGVVSCLSLIMRVQTCSRISCELSFAYFFHFFSGIRVSFRQQNSYILDAYWNGYYLQAEVYSMLALSLPTFY